MTMKFTIVWCAIVIGCWAVNSTSSSPPQCFKLKFGEISCNQAIDSNTILKTTSSDCFQSQKGAKILEFLEKIVKQNDINNNKMEKMEEKMEKITNEVGSNNEKYQKYKKMYDEGKVEINKLTKTVHTYKVKVSTLEKKLKEKEKPVEKPDKITRTSYSLAKLRRCGSGIQNPNVVRNSQLSASHFYKSYKPSQGRLLMNSHGWYTKYNVNQWIQVDFLKNRRITGVATQGHRTGDEWVTSYRVLYRESSSNKWKCIRSASGGCVNFKGNTDRNTPVVNTFGTHINARYWRINPRAWRGAPILRFDMLTC